jgi:RNA polymerase sigma-70 factor (ECF subfamily)
MGALESSLWNGSTIVGELFPANIRGAESTAANSGARKLDSEEVKFISPARRDDWDLIRQAVVGNPEAQERLFKTHTPRLYRTAFAILRNKEDAEDTVQESWCRAYANLRSFEGRAAFSTWLTRIAINSALLHRRKKSNRVEASLNDILDTQSESLFDGTVATPPNPEQIYVKSELDALVEDQIRELPSRIQAAFRLRDIEEFSTTEAARVLGIRETALKSRVSRARTKVACGLRKRLAVPPRQHAFCGSGRKPRLNQRFTSARQPRQAQKEKAASR